MKAFYVTEKTNCSLIGGGKLNTATDWMHVPLPHTLMSLQLMLCVWRWSFGESLGHGSLMMLYCFFSPSLTHKITKDGHGQATKTDLTYTKSWTSLRFPKFQNYKVWFKLPCLKYCYRNSNENTKLLNRIKCTDLERYTQNTNVRQDFSTAALLTFITCEMLPLNCKMFSKILGLYILLQANRDNQKCLLKLVQYEKDAL